MMKLDKRNDPDWCHQFFAPVFGVLFLVIGIAELVQRRGNSTGYLYFGVGVVQLVKGFVHAARWRKKKRAFERALVDCFK